MAKKLDEHKVFKNLIILDRIEREMYSYDYNLHVENEGLGIGGELSEEDWTEMDESSSSFDSADAFLFSENDEDDIENIDDYIWILKDMNWVTVLWFEL